MSQEVREPLPALPQTDEARLRRRLDALRDVLIETSHKIHARPEIRFEEFYASELVGGENGDKAVVDGALVLAMTAGTLFRHREVVDRVKGTFVAGTRAS